MQRARLMGRRELSSFLTHSHPCSGDGPLRKRPVLATLFRTGTRLGGLLSPSPAIPPKTGPQSLFASAVGFPFEQRFVFPTSGTFLWLNTPKTF